METNAQRVHERSLRGSGKKGNEQENECGEIIKVGRRGEEDWSGLLVQIAIFLGAHRHWQNFPICQSMFNKVDRPSSA